MQRLLHEGMDAGLCGFSIQRLGPNSVQADFDGSPMVTDTMGDEDILGLGRGARRARRGLHPDHAGHRRHQGRPRVPGEAGGGGPPADPLQRRGAGPQRSRGPPRPMRWIERCREKGLPMFAQCGTGRAGFAFTLEHWNLYDASPAWRAVTTGTKAEKIEKMQDPELRKAAGRRGRNEADTRLRVIQAGVGGNPAETSSSRASTARPTSRSTSGAVVGDIAEERGQAPDRGHARPVAGRRPQRRVPRPGQGLERRVHGRDDRRRPTRSPACPTVAPTRSSSPAAPTRPTS